MVWAVVALVLEGLRGKPGARHNRLLPLQGEDSEPLQGTWAEEALLVQQVPPEGCLVLLNLLLGALELCSNHQQEV